MGADVAAVAEDAGTKLRRRAVMMPELDDALARALSASDALAMALDRKGRDVVWARAQTILALDALIGRLKNAQPNERAKALGHDW